MFNFKFRQAAALFATILYLADWKVPTLGYKNNRFAIVRTNIFGQYPVNLESFRSLEKINMRF